MSDNAHDVKRLGGISKRRLRLKNPTEIWKRSGAYFISSLGNIKTWKGRVIRQYTNCRGYKFITWRRKSKFVHTLVATTFYGRPNDNPLDVHHKDFTKDNNAANNLEWLSRKEHIHVHRNNPK